jgi:hypothetical protein
LDIKPVMLPFFTLFKVDVDKHILKPYMASLNHNVINETTWLNIVPTFMGNFCHKSDSKNNTMPMEDMGNDACVIVGYHNNVSVFILNVQYFPKLKTLLAMWHNLCENTACFFSKTQITKLQ